MVHRGCVRARGRLLAGGSSSPDRKGFVVVQADTPDWRRIVSRLSYLDLLKLKRARNSTAARPISVSRSTVLSQMPHLRSWTRPQCRAHWPSASPATNSCIPVSPTTHTSTCGACAVLCSLPAPLTPLHNTASLAMVKSRSAAHPFQRATRIILDTKKVTSGVKGNLATHVLLLLGLLVKDSDAGLVLFGARPQRPRAALPCNGRVRGRRVLPGPTGLVLRTKNKG